MKKDIHPKYGASIIRCACGNVIETKSTKPEIRVDICSACHPFFTGQLRLVDTAGRIDKFQKKYAGKVVSKGTAKPTKVKKTKEERKAVKAETKK